jgi:hypothetical protein
MLGRLGRIPLASPIEGKQDSWQTQIINTEVLVWQLWVRVAAALRGEGISCIGALGLFACSNAVKAASSLL